jgi:hypothetical protein
MTRADTLRIIDIRTSWLVIQRVSSTNALISTVSYLFTVEDWYYGAEDVYDNAHDKSRGTSYAYVNGTTIALLIGLGYY